MIRRVKLELGAIASKMWNDAKYAGNRDDRTLLASMCEYPNIKMPFHVSDAVTFSAVGDGLESAYGRGIGYFSNAYSHFCWIRDSVSSSCGIVLTLSLSFVPEQSDIM